MTRAGNLRNPECIVETKSAANSNRNAVSGQRDELSELGGTGDDVYGTTRGEDSMTTCGNHILEGALWIRNSIEGAVEGDLERVSQLNKLSRTLYIDRAVSEEYANNNTCGTNAPRVFNLFANNGERHLIVIEISGVGTHEDVKGDAARLYGAIRQRPRRCETVDLKGCAKLYAVRSPLLSSQTCFQRRGTKFKFDWVAQRIALQKSFRNCSRKGEQITITVTMT